MDFKRITIFTGNYGSGKTELSINYSLLLASKNSDVLLVDLDVINPYFRSREKAELLEEKGIEVIYPKNLTYADLPIIPPEVHKLILNKQYKGVIDVGGDEEGAIALGSISRKLTTDDYEMVLVVNTFRTRTKDLKGIIETKKRIEKRSKLQFTHLICNANLGMETTLKNLEEGYQVIKTAAEQLALPIKFIAVREDLLPLPPHLTNKEEILPVRIFMKPPWAK